MKLGIDRRLTTLACGIFVNTTGILIVTGMLNEMSTDLGMPVAAVGQLNTISALTVAIGAPTMAVVTSTMQRRNVLVAAMVLAACGGLLASLSTSFTMLALARMLTAGATSLYMPQAVSSVAVMFPADRRGKAISILMLGMSSANVLGIPLGIWTGSTLGWRATLLAIGTLAAVIALLIAMQIPRKLPITPLDRRSWGELWRKKAMVLVLVFSVAQGAAAMTLFTYIAPVLHDLIAAPAGTIALLLGLYGASGIIANILGARFIDRLGPFRSVLVSVLCIVAGMLLLLMSRGSVALAGIAICVWGLGGFTIGTGQQMRLIALNPVLATVAVGFNTSCFYVGMAFGAVAGGALISTLGVGSLNIAALILMLPAFGALLASEVMQLTRLRQRR